MANLWKITVTAGNTLTTFDMDGVKIGLGICCDLFYCEMATLYRKFGKFIQFDLTESE